MSDEIKLHRPGSANIVDQDSLDIDGEPDIQSLRPDRLQDYVGQREVVDTLNIAIEAALKRQEPLEHVHVRQDPVEAAHLGDGFVLQLPEAVVLGRHQHQAALAQEGGHGPLVGHGTVAGLPALLVGSAAVPLVFQIRVLVEEEDGGPGLAPDLDVYTRLCTDADHGEPIPGCQPGQWLYCPF